MGIGRAETGKAGQSKLRQNFRSIAMQLALLATVVVAALQAGGCAGVVSGSSTNNPTQQAALQVSTANISFGNVTTGKKGTSTLTLSNAGTADLTISALTVSGTGFTATGITAPATIAVGQSGTLTVNYAPTAAGAGTGSITIISNDPLSPMSVALTGTAVAPAPGQLTVSPASISFGNVNVGSNQTQSTTISNNGDAPIHISQVNLTGAAFTASGVTAPATLNAGQSVTLQVKYAPTAVESSTGSISVVSDASNSPASLALTGSGVQAALSVSPASIDFGNVNSGSSKSQTVTLTNTGSASLSVSSATMSGTDFAVTGLTAPLTIAAGKSSSFSIAFSPKGKGKSNGKLSINNNAPGSPGTVDLTGTGAQAAISVSPASIDFGSLISGQSKSQTVTVSNTGNATLTISAASLSGTGFSVNGLSTPLSISAGQSETFSVQYAPKAAGDSTGSLSLTSNASASATTVALSGTSNAATFSMSAAPNSLAFGNINAGASSTKTVTISNTGNSKVTISQVNVTGGGISVTGIGASTTIAPSASATMTVQFQPTSAGAVSGMVTVVNSNGASTSVSVTGTGVQAGLSVTPTSVSFGSVVTGDTNSQTIQVKNTGNASLTISQATLSGSAYSVTGLTTPLVLGAGQSSTFNVQFAPTNAGSASGSLSIVSNAPNSPTTISLSGTGTATTLTLSASTSSLSFGNVNTGASSSKTVTLTNTGNANVKITQVTASGSAFSVSAGSLPVTLSPSQALTLTVLFAPTASGSASGSVSVVSNATGSPNTITLSGSGMSQPVNHTVSLSWSASASTVSGYNVYRSTVSGGSYTKVNGSMVGSLSFTDSSVQSGTTYYYVATSVDGNGTESVYSNEVSANVP